MAVNLISGYRSFPAPDADVANAWQIKPDQCLIIEEPAVLEAPIHNVDAVQQEIAKQVACSCPAAYGVEYKGEARPYDSDFHGYTPKAYDGNQFGQR